MFNTKILRSIATLFCLAFFSALSHSTPLDTIPYDLKFKVKGLKEKQCYLGYYVGPQTYIVDSAKVDTLTGAVRFNKEQGLPEGLYFLASEKGIYFDFIVSGRKEFTIETIGEMPYDSATITKSDENKYYFDYVRFVNQKQLEIAQLKEKYNLLKRATKDKAVFEELDKLIAAAYQNVEVKANEIIAAHPDLFVATLLKSSKIPKVDLPTFLDGKPNPAYQYAMRTNFWSNFDFTDSRLMRTKLYASKLQIYIEQVTPPRIDSVKQSADCILGLTKPNLEFYQYTLRWLTQKVDGNTESLYAESLFVHLVDKYHHQALSGTDKYSLERMDYKANLVRPNLLGQFAPDIKLPDSTGLIQSLYELKADYTVLFFFSSLCDHCRKATPIVKSVCEQYEAKGIKVFAVNTDGISAPWKEFISSNNLRWTNVIAELESPTQKAFAAYNLPVIYILDKNKKIIVKKIKAEQLDSVLKQLTKL
jgi:peroxiredoxin